MLISSWRCVVILFALLGGQISVGCANFLHPSSADPTSRVHSESLRNEIWARELLATPRPKSLAPRQKEVKNEQEDWQQLAQLKEQLPPGSIDLLDEQVSVTATALPLNTLLRAIAQQLSLRIHFTEPLNRAVTWTIPQQPAREVLDQLALQFNLNWRFSKGVITVSGSTPYTAFYPVDYLNIERQFTSNVGLATQVGSMRGVQNSAASAVENSSSTTINNSSHHAFWQSLSNDLEVWLAGDSTATRWAINPDSGLISLHASPNTHRQLKRYLQQIAISSQRQVLIEASVVEVLLSDDFEAGIDWQWLARGLDGVNAIQQLHGLGPLPGAAGVRPPTPSGLITFAQRNSLGDFSATVSLLERFGDVRIVSRPQILAMNNQPAVLKVVDNRVYFTVNVERQQSDETIERVTETSIHTVPVGLVMNVTPHISANDEVMLNVRPSLSRILGFANDPNPDLSAANIRNGVPEIQVREMESVLRVPSGRIAVIGGLMQSVNDDRHRQLPGLAGLPGLGALFGQQRRQRQRTELFIVIKPTVMYSNNPSEVIEGLM